MFPSGQGFKKLREKGEEGKNRIFGLHYGVFYPNGPQ